MTVLEWLNRKRAFSGRVAAFGAWDVFPYILNAPRAQFLVNAGFDPLNAIGRTPTVDLLNHLKTETPSAWDEEPYDSLTFYTALEYLKARKPRVLFLSLGETDEWAHGGNYVAYLTAAQRVDTYLKMLWETVQSMGQYRNKPRLWCQLTTDAATRQMRHGAVMGQRSPVQKPFGWLFLARTRPRLPNKRLGKA